MSGAKARPTKVQMKLMSLHPQLDALTLHIVFQKVDGKLLVLN